LSRVDLVIPERNKTMICPGCGKSLKVRLDLKLKYDKKMLPDDPKEELILTATI